jgi:hypothetical protein
MDQHFRMYLCKHSADIHEVLALETLSECRCVNFVDMYLSGITFRLYEEDISFYQLKQKHNGHVNAVITLQTPCQKMPVSNPGRLID